MNPVAAALFGVLASTLAGVLVVVALVSGVTGMWPLLIAAAMGGVLAVPAVWIISRMMGK